MKKVILTARTATSPALTSLPASEALDWLARWDQQQTGYLPKREERFDVMLDVLADLLPESFVALDVCSGPGAISRRLLTRFPAARVVALDLDPVLLSLGRSALGDADGRLQWLEADLGKVQLAELLAEVDLYPGHVNVALSTTALHWLNAPQLKHAYAQLFDMLAPGGLLLNGDNMPFGEGLTAHQRYSDQQTEREKQAAWQGGTEDWNSWWSALRGVQALEGSFKVRDERFAHHDPKRELPSWPTHRALLQEVGFAAVDTVWQRLDDRIVLGVKA